MGSDVTVTRDDQMSTATPESEGEPVRLEATNADVLRRQAHRTWRFVMDNPWGVD